MANRRAVTVECAGRTDYARMLGQMMFAQRRRARMTQAAMADFLGVGRDTYAHWEQGKTVPDAYQLHLFRAVMKEKGVLR